jgi:hypothetical protein
LLNRWELALSFEQGRRRTQRGTQNKGILKVDGLGGGDVTREIAGRIIRRPCEDVIHLDPAQIEPCKSGEIRQCEIRAMVSVSMRAQVTSGTLRSGAPSEAWLEAE